MTEMPATSRLFVTLGFHVWHIPGVSRAWRREFSDGSFLLVTDSGGYDLPEPDGPWSGMFLSRRDEFIELAPPAARMQQVVRWIRHTERLFARRISMESAAEPVPETSETTPAVSQPR